MITDMHSEGHYSSEDGKVIVPKEMSKDNYFSTDSIWLSVSDDINNYEEIDVDKWERLKNLFDSENAQ